MPPDDTQPFDWSSALELIVLMADMNTSCTEFVLGAHPAFLLAPDELEDIITVERIVRDLWTRYFPERPSLYRFPTIADENAAVDAYESRKDALRKSLMDLADGEEWRSVFSTFDHAAIQNLRSIIMSRRMKQER